MHTCNSCGQDIDFQGIWGLCSECGKAYCGKCIPEISPQSNCFQRVIISECCNCGDTRVLYDMIEEDPFVLKLKKKCKQCLKPLCNNCLWNGTCSRCREEREKEREKDRLALEALIDEAHGCIIRRLPKDACIESTFYVPTEFVVDTPRICTPGVGRVYRLTFSTASVIFICEVWENHGSDGHIEFQFENRYVLCSPRMEKFSDLCCTKIEELSGLGRDETEIPIELRKFIFA